MKTFGKAPTPKASTTAEQKHNLTPRGKRVAKIAKWGGVLGLSAASVVAGYNAGQNFSQPERKVTVEATVGGNLSTLWDIASAADSKYENNAIDVRAIVEEIHTQREDYNLKHGIKSDPNTVLPGEVISFQLPQTDQTDLALKTQKPDDLSRVGEMRIVTPTPNS